MLHQDDSHLQRLIDQAIRRHEIRVALWSGILGAALLLGTFHAIAMLRYDLHSLSIVGS
jgi:hypothetical protein